jgi:predicted O-methyltransferase YrrM
LTAISSEVRLRLMRSNSDYRHLYAELRDYGLPVSRDTGRLLYVPARSTGARSIVEFGTSLGPSTLHLASALRDNDSGRLITTAFEPPRRPPRARI